MRELPTVLVLPLWGANWRRVRSTRRHEDVPELPRQRIPARTVGRTYVSRDGTVHQPSMWLTLTLDSYGPVHSIHAGRPCACRHWHHDTDPQLGTPIDPDSDDYLAQEVADE